MPSMTFGLMCVAAGWLLIYAIIQADARKTPSGYDGFALGLSDRWAALTVGGLWLLVLIFYVLWWRAGGHFATRDIGESHTTYLTAVNARDFVTSLLADHATSPDPVAHPYVYTHHPGMVHRYVSIALNHLGIGFEGQTLIALVASAFCLALAYVALRRMFSSTFASLFVLATAASYWSYWYAAGDLGRSYHLDLVWLFLFVLSRNPGLGQFGWNIIAAILSFLVTSTDWAVTAFCLTFVSMWATYQRRQIPVRAIIVFLALPAAVSVITHQLLVIYVMGRDFWVFDLLTTYFSRGGLEAGTREAEYLARYRDARVVVWHASGHVDTREFLSIFVRTFVWNSGILALAYFVALPAILVRATRQARWSTGVILLVVVPAAAALSGVTPFPVIVISVVTLGLSIGVLRPADDDELTRVSTFGVLLLLAMLTQSGVFPSYSFVLLLREGRLPFGLLYSALFAVSALFVLRRLSSFWDVTPWSKLEILLDVLTRIRRPAFAVIALCAILLLAFFRMPGWIFALILFPLGAVWAWSDRNSQFALTAARWIQTRSESLGIGMSVAQFWALFRLLTPAVLVGVAIFFVFTSQSGQSALRGLLAVIALIAAYVIAGEWQGRSLLRLVEAGIAAAGGSISPIARRIRGAHLAAAAVAALFILQIGWSGALAIKSPPIGPPYADLLRSPPYRNASFLVWTYDGVAWLYTRGWTYTSETVPPDLSRPNLRWRHLADWENEAKYSRPQYFLCDQSRFRWDAIRQPPDQSGPTTTPPSGLQCKDARRCTCEDVAAAMVKQGHQVEVANPQFSIVRFSWQP